MLSKAAKNDIVKRFSEVFKANPSVMLVEYKGLTVAELEGLRSNLKDADTEFKIVKNKLLKIAAKDTEIEQINDLLVGPTAIAVCESDPTAAAKVFVKTAKDLPLLVIKGGVVEGNMVSVDDITAISKLPSRQEMMAQLLGALSSPMSNLLGAFTQMQSKLLYALEAVKDTKEETAAEESKVEAVPESKEEAPVEAPVESKEEKNEGAEVETKAEEKTEIKEEDGAESTGQNEVDSKEES
ncbi:MAG: 50S ribosomal protein L10 [Thermodesulfobacteriota bacterium]